MTLAPQHRLQELPIDGVVIDDKDPKATDTFSIRHDAPGCAEAPRLCNDKQEGLGTY